MVVAELTTRVVAPITYLGDCLEILPKVVSGSVDMVFADLPYGVTHNKWDTVIPLEPLWEQLLRVGKRNAAFVFTATQPFATALINSQPKLFRYDLVWEKSIGTGFLNASRMPLRAHEHVLLFYYSLPAYNPQMQKAEVFRGASVRKGPARSANYGHHGYGPPWNDNGLRHPRSIFRIASVKRQNSLHPTQKPAALLEWLIKTYSNPGDTVLDPVMGSGTTGVACVNTGRSFIGIEKDLPYFATANARMGLQGAPPVKEAASEIDERRHRPVQLALFGQA